MVSSAFTRLETDHYCYSKCFENSYIMLLLYVDDMLVVGSNMKEVVNLKASLAEEFSIKDLGPARKILGMRIKRKKRLLKVSQTEYVKKVLKTFNMTNAKPVNVPLGDHFKLSEAQIPTTEDEKTLMSEVPYTSVVGRLMYDMVCTRLDIAQAVGVVSTYMSNPGKEYWRAIKWILRYLNGNLDMTLCYGGMELLGYVDSDFMGDVDSRRSTIGLKSGALSLVSRLQKIIALSTMEAEYVAATEGCKELIWLKDFLKELEKEQKALSLNSDIQSVINLANNPIYHDKTKHFDV